MVQLMAGQGAASSAEGARQGVLETWPVSQADGAEAIKVGGSSGQQENLCHGGQLMQHIGD